MNIGPVAVSRTVVNNLFGLWVALAVVWGIPMFGRQPVSSLTVPQIGVAELTAQRASGKPPLIVDVRGPEAYGKAHLEGALHIPLDQLQARIQELPADLAAPLVVYCGNGSNLGPKGTAKLQAMGYTHVANLSGGIEGWRAAGNPVAGGNG